jgi:hypothetical protein
MGTEVKDFSAGPHSGWIDGTHLKVKIKEHRYGDVIWFKVFVGSDSHPISKDEYSADIEWRLYLNRDAMPRLIQQQTYANIKHVLTISSTPWLFFEVLDYALDAYERETNAIRKRFGFPERTIPRRWRSLQYQEGSQ